MKMEPPEPKWTDKSREDYARWFVDCYYYEPEDGQTYARRSDADAYEEWKPVAAALGVWRTQEIDIPPDFQKRIARLYDERGEPAPSWDEELAPPPDKP